RENPWEFDPTHKIILVTNHKPHVRGTDYALWRRVKLVPFTVTIAEGRQDKQLGEELRAQARGILAWLVQGCLDWLRNGLVTPSVVTEATEEYRRGHTGAQLGGFLHDC